MRTAPGLIAGALLLTACTVPVAQSPVPPAPATSAASTTAEPTAAPAATVLPVPTYSGARAMPASAGGHMLWPTTVPVTIQGNPEESVSLHGFVDETGTLVVPERYEGYEYCRDAAGRTAFIIATAAGRKADVLDLSGKVVVRAPMPDATCGPPGLVTFTRVIDGELGKVYDGLMEVPSGAIVLPLVTGRKLTVVNADTVNVAESGGEYFLNPRTRKRTAHPGYVTDAPLEDGAPGVPASTVSPDRDGGRVGYLGLDGKWVLAPTLEDASAFSDGHAIIQLAEDRYTFLDTALHRVGGEWDSIETEWVDGSSDTERVGGYLVSGPSGEGLLRSDLRAIVAPAKVTITCPQGANGGCTVLSGTRSSLAVLPEGTVAAMPDGFTQAVSRTVVADTVRTDDDDSAASRLHAVGSGASVALDGPSSCRAVADAWISCQPIAHVLPPVVVDGQGRRTAFATIDVVKDPTSAGGAAAYYWVVAGKYRGFIDADGQWLYRASRYTRVEE